MRGGITAGVMTRSRLTTRLIEQPHMGVASGEIAIRHREVRGLFDREEQLCYRFVEASAQKVGGADYSMNRADPGAWSPGLARARTS